MRRVARAAAMAVGLSLLGGVEASGPAQRRAAPDRADLLAMVLALEDSRVKAPGDLDRLREIARTSSGAAQAAAVRALGRLERRTLVPDLLPLLAVAPVRAEAADALVQSFQGPPVPGSSSAQIQVVLDALVAAGASEITATSHVTLGAIARSIGRLPYERADQVATADRFLRDVLSARYAAPGRGHADAARALESLARLRRKIAPISSDTVELLRTAARLRAADYGEARRTALSALIAAQQADLVTLTQASEDASPETRRLALLALLGAASPAGATERIDLARTFLADASAMVRVEAVRGWASRASSTEGCQPILALATDRNLHVALTVIDALGERCQDAAEVTERLAALAVAPGRTAEWRPAAHALVALTRRDRARAAVVLESFAAHPTWQVRMYAARAAALEDDVVLLRRLAADADHNVVEAALPALRRLQGAASDDLFLAALRRASGPGPGAAVLTTLSLVRTIAGTLEGASGAELAHALADALRKISEQHCETSRDARLAIIERLDEIGTRAQEAALVPLLKDIDPVVAAAGAQLLSKWTARPVTPEPRLYTTPGPFVAALVTEPVTATVELEGGRSFTLRFLDSVAPLSRERFLRLAGRRYYDGLTFHRVVSNFVIQGGSPGANEYCGDCPFMRDEVGLARHTRGTVGISTRGRDTGDAQIFINLVDNARLDHQYTVFAEVEDEGGANGMSVVDTIQEGDRIRRVTITRER